MGTKVSAKGQIVVAAELRTKYGIPDGDVVVEGAPERHGAHEGRGDRLGRPR